MDDTENVYDTCTVGDVPTAMYQLDQRVEVLLMTTEILRGWCEDVADVKSSSRTLILQAVKNVRNMKTLNSEVMFELNILQGKIEKLRVLKKRCLFILNNLPKWYNKISEVQPKPAAAANAPLEDTKKGIKLSQGSALFNIPPVSFLTEEDFVKVPKYLKGRLKYEKVNEFIEVFNDVLSKKYAIAKLKKSDVKRTDYNRWKEFKEQEIKETIGYYFCIANDISTLGNFSMDKTAYNILTILRACGRVREVRSAGIVRYVAMY